MIKTTYGGKIIKRNTILTASFVLLGLLFSFSLAEPGQAAGGQTLYDFLDHAPEAYWEGHDPQQYLSYGLRFGEFSSPKGTAAPRQNVILEDGRRYDQALDTHPTVVKDGRVVGVYDIPDLRTQPGDRFVARVGFRQGSGTGAVTFKVVTEYFALDQKTGEDIYPPITRSL